MSHHGFQAGLPGGHLALPGEILPLPHWTPDFVRFIDTDKMVFLEQGQVVAGTTVNPPAVVWVRRPGRR